MELIDKSAVVAEIERRRDLHYKYYVKNGAGSIAECKYEEDRDILDFLDTLETKELPSLPSNLDEAAKDYARCYTESDNGNGGDDWEDDILIAFKAGTRWLAEKGVTMSIDDNTEWEDVDTFVHRNVDSKTVIQIRKI